MIDPFLTEWLNLIFRWAHLIAGIAWIGTSFYFVALDYSLKSRVGLPKGVMGEAWEVHGGGFYHVRKYLSAPETLPADLVWFKWEAYLAWVTGFLLLIVQYYIDAGATLIDPQVLALTPWQAIAISVLSLAAGWIAYDQLCRAFAAQHPAPLAGLTFGLILAAAYGYTEVYSGRGAFIHIGIFIGTLMAANVFMVIIPNQRKITAALIAGRAPDPGLGLTGKQRSLHNTYLTLPVLAMMVSNHFAMVTGHPQAWLIAGLIVAGGAAARHLLLRIEVGDRLTRIAWTLPIIALCLAAAYAMTWSGAVNWDWINFILRWGHMIAGIAWIGTSFYFVALDFGLRTPKDLPAGVSGEAWEVHGGGFYHVQKYLNAPASLPPSLIWFKWEAYLTWVTGFLLLVALYYVNASSYLIDPAVMTLTPWQAIGISLVSLALGWAVYDLACRSRLGRHGGALALAVFALILASAWAFTHVFSGRGALIHAGALAGTIMAANVFMVIIPGQRKTAAALIAGLAPDPRHGAAAKQRSLHNTYLTLPVLLLMVSNHYPMIADHPLSWLIVGLIVLGGAALRHFLVRIEVGDAQAQAAFALPLIGGALGLALLITEPKALPAFQGEVADGEALSIVQARCASCHAAKPKDRTVKAPPKGIALETVEDVKRYARQIEAQAVNGRSMPLGNKTGMTAEERGKLGAWISRL